MSRQQNCKLIYFRQYSDFSFQVEEDFTVTVSENQDSVAEIFVEYSGISCKVVSFHQCALAMFREVSPTDWICRSSGYLIRLFQEERCITCQSMEKFLEIKRKKY